MKNYASKYAVTLVMAVGIAVIMTAAAVTTSTYSAYADKENGGNGDCTEDPKNDNPNFNELVTRGASESTGNPHTCEHQTGDPHDDEDNPQSGNPHNDD